MNRRGLITIYVFFALIFVSTFGATLLSRSIHADRVAHISADWQRALPLADAAIETSMWNLHVGDFNDLAAAQMSGGSYWADLNPTEAPLQFAVVGHGLFGTMQRNVEVMAQVTPTSIFQFGLFGSERVEVDGNNRIDSFHSAQGAYDPAAPGSNGDVGTNATTYGGMEISGSIYVNGQVAVGAQVADPQSIVDLSGGSATITGDPPFQSQQAPLPMLDVVVPPELQPLCTDMVVAGQTTIVLPAGEYCFNNLVVGGGSTLTADGPVKIYITNYFHATGNATVGVMGDPTQLQMLFMSSSQATIESTMAGTTDFYGGMYGPTARISIGGDAQVYGSVIGRTVELEGTAQIHYDEALADAPGPIGFYRVRVLTWREL